MTTTLRALLVIPLLLPLSGCCALAALWCGPDRSEWVAQSFRTPPEAVATFREAVRRCDVAVIATCFSEGFQERHGLHGSVDIAVVWDRLTKEVPGLHLLGRAEIAPFTALADGRQLTTLRVMDHVIEITLARQEYWLVRAGELQRSRFVRTIADSVTMPSPAERAELLVRVPAALPDVAKQDIDEVSVAREWKVDDVREPRREVP